MLAASLQGGNKEEHHHGSSHIGSRITRSSSGSVSELPGPTPGTQQQQQAERPDSRSSSQGDLSNDSVYDSLGATIVTR